MPYAGREHATYPIAWMSGLGCRNSLILVKYFFLVSSISFDKLVK